MPNDPARPIGSATQAFLEQLESTSLPLTMLDKAQAYAVCATIEAYNGNTAGAYGILSWFDEHLETVRAPRPREIARIMNRARARVASTVADRDSAQKATDPLHRQNTGFTTPGITRRHR
jgi:hypothetical protein